jgi:outer membrane protein assembly factor BamE (lipoprotein component of BamABCDE complex)
MLRVFALMASLLFAGCGAYITSINNSNINTVLKVGMTRDEVIAIMGTPQKREAYGRTEFLIYRTSLNTNDPNSFTPIAIVDGRVIGWGRNFYDNAVKADITVRQR